MTATEKDDVALRRDALAARLFQATLGFFDIISVYLGERLGLYRALLDIGPSTSAELAQRTATDERYVREWLEQQASAGLLELHNADGPAEQRRFGIAPGHGGVLADTTNLSYMAGIARLAIGAISPLPAVLQAYRSGAGVPYADYGADAREGIAEMNRPMFLKLLGTEWLPAIPDVHLRLQSTPGARVADVGCGTGWSSIALARAYPLVHVDGFDLDAASIAEANANARAKGLTERLTFHVRDASDPSLAGRYDLVVAFETLHDMARPVDALRTMRSLCNETGCVLIADERVEDSLAAPAGDIDRFNYGWSIVHCLPASRTEPRSAATGTVMRPATLRNYAREAGFRDVEVLPIDNDFWRFYRLIG